VFNISIWLIYVNRVDMGALLVDSAMSTSG